MEGAAENHTHSLVFQYLMFASLGLICSILWTALSDNSGQQRLAQTQEYSLETFKEDFKGINCENFKKESQIPDNLKRYMGTKLIYQFEYDINDESFMDQCHAIKLYGLIRHGTRFPTSGKLKKWEETRNSLDKLLPSDRNGNSSIIVQMLKNRTNSIRQMMTGARANAADLMEHGMKEQYCLGKRLSQRFPELLRHPPHVFGVTSTSRTIMSALSYAQGIFEDSQSENITLKTNDTLLRFYDFPCPEYDQKVTNNKSLEEWLESFFETPTFKAAIQNVQQHFNLDYWKLEAKDLLTLYDICIHEMNLLGRSSWCDLFDTEQLSALQYYTDLRTYWTKGGGYAITGKRSVHLIEDIINFLMTGKESVALSFAHTETILPLLGLLKMFPVSEDLTPTNYNEQKSRFYVTSQMSSFSANVLLVLYDCHKASGRHKYYVRVLVNEKPMRIGLCVGGDEEAGQWEKSLMLCSVERLRECVHNATEGFSKLTKLCKVTS